MVKGGDTFIARAAMFAINAPKIKILELNKSENISVLCHTGVTGTDGVLTHCTGISGKSGFG